MVAAFVSLWVCERMRKYASKCSLSLSLCAKRENQQITCTHSTHGHCAARHCVDSNYTRIFARLFGNTSRRIQSIGTGSIGALAAGVFCSNATLHDHNVKYSAAHSEPYMIKNPQSAQSRDSLPQLPTNLRPTGMQRFRDFPFDCGRRDHRRPRMLRTNN